MISAEFESAFSLAPSLLCLRSNYAGFDKTSCRNKTASTTFSPNFGWEVRGICPKLFPIEAQGIFALNGIYSFERKKQRFLVSRASGIPRHASGPENRWKLRLSKTKTEKWPSAMKIRNEKESVLPSQNLDPRTRKCVSYLASFCEKNTTDTAWVQPQLWPETHSIKLSPVAVIMFSPGRCHFG